jgi:hypothetical protein
VRDSDGRLIDGNSAPEDEVADVDNENEIVDVKVGPEDEVVNTIVEA